jgi:hypothetical protein
MSATESLRRPKLNLLVTGCTGRVGVAACADLLAAGHCVVGIDVREPESNADYDFRLCDLNQEGALHPHLQNIDAGVQHVVVASSINAIGYLFGTSSFETDYLPIDEAHPKTTTDTYSFSKQVTEDIGAYLARREGITNACLHFRAGLATLPELRQRIGSELRDTRTLVEELAAQDAQSARAELDRMQAAYNTARHDRMYEGGSRSALPPAELRLMTLRHNYFSFIELSEACRANAPGSDDPLSGPPHTFYRRLPQHAWLACGSPRPPVIPTGSMSDGADRRSVTRRLAPNCGPVEFRKPDSRYQRHGDLIVQPLRSHNWFRTQHSHPPGFSHNCTAR